MDIVLDNVSKSFDGVKILDNLSLTLNEGSTVCIMGPSGCGKTTLLNIVAGLVLPDSGKVCGTIGRRMAYVFQEPRLLPWKTVVENVELVMGEKIPKEQKRRKAMQYLDMVLLADAAQMMPDMLSGGMAQRVGIARALAAEAEILLLDEPFSSLDESMKNTIFKRLIAHFQKNGTTVAMVTHSAQDCDSLGAGIIRFGN